jgi:hypothetical protein
MIKKSSAVWLSLIIGLYTCSSARVLRVPSEYPVIQNGINAAIDGDTVLVAPGTYTGPGNRGLDFLGRRITVISETGSDETVIDCEQGDRGFYFHTGEDTASILEGFTITNGEVSGESSGGGIFCMYASPMIRDNVITNCYAYWGGGIGCVSASPIIIGNTIIDNEGERGGGFALLSASHATVTNNVIQSNTAIGG